MSVSNDFSVLNVLRPKDAVYGEVVCIELRHASYTWDSTREEWNLRDAEYLGYSKRKQLMSQPGVNAYWNFVNLRSLVTQLCSRKGLSRQTRSFLYGQLNMIVRKIHLYELETTYGHRDAVSHQYYVVTLAEHGPVDGSHHFWTMTVKEAS